jgi:hypothetical protein
MYVRVYVRVYVCELTQIAFEESRVLQVCPMRASELGWGSKKACVADLSTWSCIALWYAEQQKEGLLNKLTDVGFDSRQAERAHMLLGGDLDRAIELCLSGMQ